MRAAAEAWLAEDPDPETRAELAAVLETADEAGLADRFGSRLQFGTAGLRGELGAGPNRMNRVLVRRAAAGVAAWVRASGRAEGGVAVGFDARRKSRDFAEDTAAVLAGAGLPVHLLAGPLPTPVLAFAVRHLGAAAGVMVTASHNPARDNGYKVYDHTGAQIILPDDATISAAIDAVGPLSVVTLAAADHPGIHRLGDEVVEGYLAAVASMLPGPPGELSIVYTPLHGVGGELVSELLVRAGFAPPHLVVEQYSSHPDFPTVAFPSPEEPGALDLALAEAGRVGADAVMANDPDADRLAVALPDPATQGGWRRLSGDEVGVLLADAVFSHPPAGSGGGESADLDPVVATTIVSSQLLSKMAAVAGVAYQETLTGFKWVARAAGPGRRLLFGYEEALGYCVGDLVADKDGMSALLAFALRIVALRREGHTVLDRLDELARTHGSHATTQRSFRLEGADGSARIAGAMTELRAAPPAELAGRAVRTVDDLADPTVAERLGLPTADVVVLRLDAARVVVRPSGTEPKLKTYVEVVRPVGPGADGLVAARDGAAAEAAVLGDAVAAVLALG